jgi:hypothetical protein
MSFARMCRGSSLELFRSYTVRIGYTAVSVDRRTLKIDPFRERNSVLFQSDEKYKTHPSRVGFVFMHRGNLRSHPAAVGRRIEPTEIALSIVVSIEAEVLPIDSD